MKRRQLYNVLLVLLTLVGALYLLRLVWTIAAPFTDLLLMFGMAWLITFIFRPVAVWLAEGPPAQILIAAIRRRGGEPRAHRTARVLMPIAVTLVYLALLVILVVTVIAFIPLVVTQAKQFALTLTDYLRQAPDWLAGVQISLVERLDLPPELVSQLYRPTDLTRSFNAVIEATPRVVASLIRGIGFAVGETLLVLALSYYLMLDGQRLARQIHDLVPNRFHDEYEFTVSTISRTFGGFLRGQLVMAVFSCVVTAVAAGVAGVRYGAIIGAIVGLVIIIPLVGAPIAMFLPSILALLQGVPLLTAVLLLAFLFAFQQVLLHFVLPRIMSESIGMPSALVLFSVLIAVRLWGVWGFIFGIPVAGAIYAVGLVMLQRFKREQDRLDETRRGNDAP